MIIAVDFDGILCDNQFPAIGPPRLSVISAVQEMIDLGHEVILWTSRVETALADAVKWCESYGLHFCAVNDNAPSNLKTYGTNSRKIYADIYIDDHNIGYDGTVLQYELPRLLRTLRKEGTQR